MKRLLLMAALVAAIFAAATTNRAKVPCHPPYPSEAWSAVGLHPAGSGPRWDQSSLDFEHLPSEPPPIV